MRRPPHRRTFRLSAESLETRLALDGDGGQSGSVATEVPVDVGIVMPSPSSGFVIGAIPTGTLEADPDTAADAPWIAWASAGPDGAIVLRLRVSADAIGIASGIDLIWSRPSDPALPDPLLAIDPATGEPDGPIDGLVTGVVFGGAGTDPSATWPVPLDAFATLPDAGGSTAQTWYVVLRSPSNLLLGLVSMVVVLGAGVVDGGDGLPAGGIVTDADGQSMMAMSGSLGGGGFGAGGMVDGGRVAGLGAFFRRPAPAAPAVSLVHDTGVDGEDRITSDGTLAVAAAPGATVEYSVDGGRVWSTRAPRDEDGTRTVLVRQTDAWGQVSPTTSFSYTLDRRAPRTPGLWLADGTRPSAGEPTRRAAAPAPRGIESGARVEYSAAGGPWSATWPAQEGANSVRVRQIDAAGNVSAPSAPLRFRIDSVALPPGVRLARDTGWSDSDRITSDATLALSGVERGATVQYSADGGKTWNGRFSPSDGAVTVLVRQIDAVGNVSAATRFDFTVDRTPPPLPPNWAAAFTGPGNAPAARGDAPVRFEYSLRGGAWTSLPAGATLPQGRSWLRVRVVDRAGNVSAPSPVVWGTGR